MSEAALELPALIAFSRERIEKGSKSFAAASKLFDTDTRDAVHMLYAWCRHCDDVIDDQDLGFARDDAMSGEPSRLSAEVTLQTLRDDTHAALVERAPSSPVFQALSYVATKYDIPPHQPQDHIDGFAMDVRGARYDTIDDTLTYCYHVAGVVGVMMARIMGADGEDTLNRACDLGIAFQLTNICRDIVDDAKIDRVYLPTDWLSDAGLEPHTLARDDNRQQLLAVATRVLDLADRYYESAGVGIGRLPLRAAGAIAAARNVYRDIGGTIRARGIHAWDQRAGTSKGRKLARVSQGIVQAGLSRFSRPEIDRSDLWTRPARP